MKLSMWMIANRLSSLDMEVEISENAPAVLNSARRVYATNCVYVYQDGEDAVCDGEGDIIRIQNSSATQAFEIIQSVFDYFEDWAAEIDDYIRKKDYQSLVDCCWQVFHNPLVLFDANNKVLGISSRYPKDALDEEWRHLYEFGYSSINAVQMIKQRYGYIDFKKHGPQPYEISTSPSVNVPGISYCLYFGDFDCGRLNLLASERPLNTGDIQVLEYLAKSLEPVFAQYYQSDEGNTGSVFLNILMGKPYDEKNLELQLAYQQWSRDDSFFCTLIRLAPGSGQSDSARELNMLFHLTERFVPDSVVIRNSPYIVVFSNHDLSKDAAFSSRMAVLSRSNPIQIASSLPCRGLKNAGYLYGQAEAAFLYGGIERDDGSWFSFFDFAKDYLLDFHTIEEKQHAVLPGVLQMWEQDRAGENELYRTLKAYLDCNCSIAAAAGLLLTHRNTVLYRLKKIWALLGDELKSLYMRDYCKLSIQVLELYDKKCAG